MSTEFPRHRELAYNLLLDLLDMNDDPENLAFLGYDEETRQDALELIRKLKASVKR